MVVEGSGKGIITKIQIGGKRKRVQRSCDVVDSSDSVSFCTTL